ELDVIAAVVIGGGSLSGGEGSILGSIIGAFIMGVIRHGLVIIENPVELESITRDLQEQAQNLKADLVARRTLPPDWPQPHFVWTDIETALKARRPLILGFDNWRNAPPSDPAAPRPSLQTVFAPPPVFGGQIRRATADILQRRRNGERVVIASRQAARLGDLLSAKNTPLSPVEKLDYPPPVGSVTLFRGPVLEGWLLRPREGADPALTMLTDAELFGVRKPQPRRRPRKRRGITPETFFADVTPGDYVVHIEHGIGIFKGLVKLAFDDVEREYLEVGYSQNDKLYVPIHQADRLSRYVGVDDAPPTLNRLGTADWGRVKKWAKTAVADIADELLRIYAAREVVPGRAFSPDTDWQRELEAAFPYVETEDQLQAIAEVKADMERPKPMDRLICGDVGYGKTEVALRAAFKAVMDGAQVAMMVPTTVLAQQHFTTFQQRLASYPVVVEMLSRFRTRRDVSHVLKGLAGGRVDIVIGTHRLLQKDIVFKNLGLLIVDEEQRFGVSHKERLKEMRAHIDTLTLSATPIPRTLHMSMTGVRDMSVIDTPPEERLPIKTMITKADDTLIRTAILREFDRGGQVYFVHNRVLGIEQMANHIRALAPEARVKVGHGQMPERRLEQVMLDFAAGEFDVLVSTTIIESGLDIPNVNTIIINRADRFGLAQLYQLRGRVGRAAVQSYAYLLVPKNYNLPELARKRLDAIREASELGAGFKIAMRDLEIRGAGDLLGARQHGHIAAVGFDLYVRLLAQAVQALKGEAGDGETDPLAAGYLLPLGDDIQINLPLPVYLPEDYLPEEHLRLKLYRRMANLYTLEEVDAMGQELEDRFGQLPEPVVNLLYQLKLKVLCRAAGAKFLSTEDDQLIIRADSLEEVDRDVLQRRLGVGPRVGRRQIWLPFQPDPAVWQAELENALATLGRMVNDPGR
ncbi:MAG: transcription-repair coupling factor, partial [Anaerolineae bacterium]